MKKRMIYLFCLLILLGVPSCGRVIDGPEETTNTESQTQEQPTETESASGSETQVQQTETESNVGSELNTEVPTLWEDMTWEEVVASDKGYMGAKELDKEFNSNTTDLSKWFIDYNNETLQRIPSSNPDDEYNGVTTRADIIFYNTKETDIQVIVKKMIDAMILPLMEDSDTREYTVIKYELIEQPLKQINENVWLLDSISGYYSYEGFDLVTMEDALEYETDIRDGMIKFMGDGSTAAFQYLLIKDGTVYRLQRAGDMGYGVEH